MSSHGLKMTRLILRARRTDRNGRKWPITRRRSANLIDFRYIITKFPPTPSLPRLLSPFLLSSLSLSLCKIDPVPHMSLLPLSLMGPPSPPPNSYSFRQFFNKTKFKLCEKSMLFSKEALNIHICTHFLNIVQRT